MSADQWGERALARLSDARPVQMSGSEGLALFALVQQIRADRARYREALEDIASRDRAGHDPSIGTFPECAAHDLHSIWTKNLSTARRALQAEGDKS